MGRGQIRIVGCPYLCDVMTVQDGGYRLREAVSHEWDSQGRTQQLLHPSSAGLWELVDRDDSAMSIEALPWRSIERWSKIWYGAITSMDSPTSRNDRSQTKAVAGV